MKNLQEHVIGSIQERGLVIHAIASGGGTQLQRLLWQVPGASAWLSGASFPYDTAETDDLLGFKPDGYCTPDAALHLACVAYMRAFKYGRKALGLGLTASVASTRIRRGDHRIHAAIITPDACYVAHLVLPKDVGQERRELDDSACSDVALDLIAQALGIQVASPESAAAVTKIVPEQLLALVMARPVFMREGHRCSALPARCALMPGAYDPPHEGHTGVADLVAADHGLRVVHQVTVDPPHKGAVSAQGVLERAKLLRGRDVMFSTGDALYTEKAARNPGVPLIVGADALQRMLDPAWGVPAQDVVRHLASLRTTVFVSDRPVNGSVLVLDDVVREAGFDEVPAVFKRVIGSWDVSSSQVRTALGV